MNTMYFKELASVVLERIRAEHEAAGSKPKRRRRRKEVIA